MWKEQAREKESEKIEIFHPPDPSEPYTLILRRIHICCNSKIFCYLSAISIETKLIETYLLASTQARLSYVHTQRERESHRFVMQVSRFVLSNQNTHTHTEQLRMRERQTQIKFSEAKARPRTKTLVTARSCKRKIASAVFFFSSLFITDSTVLLWLLRLLLLWRIILSFALDFFASQNLNSPKTKRIIKKTTIRNDEFIFKHNMINRTQTTGKMLQPIYEERNPWKNNSNYKQTNQRFYCGYLIESNKKKRYGWQAMVRSAEHVVE